MATFRLHALNGLWTPQISGAMQQQVMYNGCHRDILNAPLEPRVSHLSGGMETSQPDGHKRESKHYG